MKEIYKCSPVLQKLRGTTVETLAVCSHCDLRYLCHGGCRATAYNIFRQMDAHNEVYCNYLELLSVNKMWGKNDVAASPN